jgi:hypothetical protein
MGIGVRAEAFANKKMGALGQTGIFANVRIRGAVGEHASTVRSIAELAVARAEQLLQGTDGHAETVTVNLTVDPLSTASSVDALAAKIVKATQDAVRRSGIRFSALFASKAYAERIAKGALLTSGPAALEFDNGKSYPLTDYVGAGGNTVIYGTNYDSRPAVVRLINDKTDAAAVLAAREFVNGVKGLANNGIPVVKVFDAASHVSGSDGDDEVFDYVVTERIPTEVMEKEKLGTYFAHLSQLNAAARNAERESAKYKAFLKFVRLTAGLKKIGDFSPDHIVYHEGEWKVYDLSANHIPYAVNENEAFNPRSSVWSKLYSVKHYQRGEAGEFDLIDPGTIDDINSTVSEARAAGLPNWQG